MNIEIFALVLFVLLAAMYIVTIWGVVRVVQTWLEAKISYAHLHARTQQHAQLMAAHRRVSPFDVPMPFRGPRNRNEDPDLQ